MAKKAEQNKVCDKTGLTLEQNTAVVFRISKQPKITRNIQA